MKINALAIIVGGIIICASLIMFFSDPNKRFPAADKPAAASIVSTNVDVAPSRGSAYFWRNHYGIGSGGELRFRLSYVFTINGKEYHGNDAVLTPPSSSKIDILYNPGDPSENEIPKVEFRRIVAVFFFVLGLLVLLVFSGVLAPRQDKACEPGQ